MRGVRQLCWLVLLFLLGWQPAFGQTSSADCDRLVGDPAAPVAPMDADAALAACRQALTDNPTDARVLYQYARVLEQTGDLATAQRLYQWSSDEGFAAAGAALARLADGPAPPPAGIDALAASIGADPAAALAWVAGAIAPDGYAGVMRGAAGTLAAGSGNDADRALLLAALIAAADPSVPVRFAECRLPDTEAAALAKAVIAARPARGELLLEAAGRLAPEMDDPEARRIAEGLGAIWGDAVAAVGRQSDELAAAIAEGAPGIAGAEMPRDALLAAVSDHVWVQAMIAGVWTDLDPASGGTAGVTRCPAAATVDALPDALYQRLDVQIVLEERSGDGLATHPVLDASFRIADIAAAPLSLMFAEPVGRAGDVPDRPAPEPGYLAYTPLLVAGSDERVGDSFVLPAPLSTPRDAPALGAADAGGGVLGAFGEAPSVADAPVVRPEGNVTAAWLALTVSSPGRPAESATGMLFDRLGFVRRQGGLVAGPLDGLPEVDGEYQALATVWSLALALGIPPASEPDLASDGRAPIDILLAGLGHLHGGWQRYRAALFAAAAPTDAPRMLSDRPSLSLLGWVPALGEDHVAEADLVMDVLLDPAAPGRRGDGRAAIAWSVSSVVAERLTVGMERLFPTLLGLPHIPAFRPVDVPVVFDAARSQGVPLVWVGPDAVGVDGSDEALARIRAHAAAGLSVLVPTRAVAVGEGTALGWWLLDPATGALRDEFENGRHQAIPEDRATEEPARESAPRFRSVGRRVACTLRAGVAAFQLGVGIANQDPEAVAEAMNAAEAQAELLEAIEKTREAGEKAAEAVECDTIK